MAPGEEVVHERTEESKTFATDDPSVFRTEVYAEPVHFEDGAGQWEDIAPEMVPAGGGDVVSSGTGVSVSMDAAGDGTEVRVELGPGIGAGFVLPTSVEPSSDTKVAGDLGRGSDIELEPVASGVKESIVLADRRAPRHYEFPLLLDGVGVSLQADGSVAFVAGDGSTVGIIPPGWMEDSSHHPVTAQPATSVGVRYAIRDVAAGTPVLVVDLDDAWLDDPARVYPVRVDPSIAQADGGLDDTFVMAYSPANRSALPHLQVGNNGYLGARSFVHFAGLDALDGKIIHQGVLKLFQNGAGSCNPSPMDVYRVGTSWTGASVTSWGTPAPVGPAVATLSSAQGRPGCGPGWVQTNVTGLVDGWASGTWDNNGLTMRARDEFAAADFKQFASGDTLAPPHIQVLWSEPSTDPPAVPTRLRPTRPRGTVSPTLSARFRDPNLHAGSVVFYILDADGQHVAAGIGSEVASGDDSEWVPPPGTLEPGETYSTVAFAVNEEGRSSVNSAPVSFSVSDVALESITDDQVVFGDQALAVVAAPDVHPATVELIVEGVTVASDATAPYELTWDTSGAADGSASVAVAAVAASTTTSPPVYVEVFNESTGPQRAAVDFGRGLLTADQYALATVQAALDSPDTPAQYVSDVSSGSTMDVLEPILTLGEDLAPATKDAIADLLEPSVGPPTPPTAGAEAGAGDVAACDQQRTATINSFLPRILCQHHHNPSNPDIPDIELFFSVGTTKHDLDTDIPPSPGEPGLGADVDPVNGIPDGVDIAIENMELAVEAYLALGYQLPSYIVDEGFTVAFHDKVGYANPWRRSGSPYSHAITLTSSSDRDELAALARHETFHVFQYRYLSTFDVAGDLCPDGWCRDGALWWIEATAEWADHQVSNANVDDDGNDTLDGADLYLRSLEDFAATPSWDLGRAFLIDPPTDLFDPRFDSRQYGAFIFAESLEERHGTSFILEVFQYIRDNPVNPLDEHDVVSALEAALDDEGTNLHTELWAFWISFYLLRGGDGDLSFEDDDVGLWRAVLAVAGENDVPEVDGDYFDSHARVARNGSVIVVDGTSETDKLGIVGRGGAEVFDLDSDVEYRDEEEPAVLTVHVNPRRWGKLSFALLRYTDEGYPNLCPSGPAVVPDEDGEVEIEWEITTECPSASVIVTHLDPNSSHVLGDTYSIDVPGSYVS